MYMSELKRKLFTDVKGKIGLVVSSFDLLHAGHCLWLKDAKSRCDFLVAGLHTDPSATVDASYRDKVKNKPIQSVEERRIQLEAIKYVDAIVEYATEADLYRLAQELFPDIWIIGSDWKGKPYTGHDLPLNVVFHDRNHSYSTTELRERIYQAEKSRRQ